MLFSAAVFAQDDSVAEKNQGWKTFNKKGWEKFDFAKKKITKSQLGKLDSQSGVVDELALLRGVVFGKRGRVFLVAPQIEQSRRSHLKFHPYRQQREPLMS